MHNSDKKLSEEINNIIDKYKNSDEFVIDDNMTDEFFNELQNAIDRSKNELYNKILKDDRKRKIKKLNKNNE